MRVLWCSDGVLAIAVVAVRHVLFRRDRVLFGSQVARPNRLSQRDTATSVTASLLPASSPFCHPGCRGTIARARGR